MVQGVQLISIWERKKKLLERWHAQQKLKPVLEHRVQDALGLAQYESYPSTKDNSEFGDEMTYIRLMLP
jgi:hypothetical protein